MSTLTEYQEAAQDDMVAELLEEQWQDLHKTGVLNCAGCGMERHHTMAFRCLYCGLYFCCSCAERHFGKTIQDYRAVNHSSNVTNK